MTIEEIQQVVARHFHTTAKQLIAKTRSPAATEARRIAMFLGRELLGLSFPELGRAFQRDHSGVMHTINALADSHDPKTKKALATLKARLSMDGLCPTCGQPTQDAHQRNAILRGLQAEVEMLKRRIEALVRSEAV